MHNIFSERFIAKREPAWHGLGQVFEAPIGALEAVETIGADFEIYPVEISVEVPERKSAYAESVYIPGIDDQPTWDQPEQKQIEIPGKRALMREPLHDDPEWRYFGTVNENYGIIQNTRLGELLDPLTDRWPVETAGLLGKGETLFLVLDAGEADIDGDLVRQYFLIADSKNGKEALKAIFTPVRVVCQNTLIAGEGASVAMRNFRHHKDIEKELGWHLNLIKDFEKVQERPMTDFRTLAKAMLADTDAWKIINASYPEPKKPAKVTLAENLKAQNIEAGDEFLADAVNVTDQFERLRERVQERRDGAYELAEATAGGRGRSELSAWDVYQGVVEVEDFRTSGKDESESGRIRRTRSAVFGDRARTKTRAFKAALKAS